MRKKLADGADRGDVAVCCQCQDVHIRWENLMLSLPRERFEAFSRMINEARSALSQESSGAYPRAVAREAWVQ